MERGALQHRGEALPCAGRDVSPPAPAGPHPRVGGWVVAQQETFPAAATWDGVVPGSMRGGLGPSDYREIDAYTGNFCGSDRPFDTVSGARLPTGDLGEVAQTIAEFEDAGVTWWLQLLEDDMGTLEEPRDLFCSGPPKG